jgi:hypothetical protein
MLLGPEQLTVLTGVNTMKLETKFMRLPMEVSLGSRFGDWQVCWGYWDKYRLYFLVMVVKLPPARCGHESQCR